MRFRNLLGLLAIGGAVAYAQKKRGGELSLNGFKNSLRDLVGNVKHQVNELKEKGSQQMHDVASRARDTDVGSRSGMAEDFSNTSGYSSSGAGSDPTRKF